MMYSVTTTQISPKPFFNFKNVTRYGAICVNVIHSRPKNKTMAFPTMIFTKFTTADDKNVLITYFI